MNKFYCLPVLFFINLKTSAQNLNLPGILPALSQTGRISNRFDYNLFLCSTIDAIERKIDQVNYPVRDFSLCVQPSLIFIYNPNVNFSGSYTYLRYYPFDKGFSNEDQLWEQALFGQNLRVGRITHRLRYEQRFEQNVEEEIYEFATRIRYQTAFSMPLQGKTLDANEFYFNGFNESFLSLTGVRNALYSDNTVYAGIGYNMNQRLGKLEIGPMWQTWVRDLEGDRRNFFLLQITLITNIHFPRKKA